MGRTKDVPKLRDAADPRAHTKYSFSGHETFPFRYAWLPKGVQLARQYPDLFLRDDAIVILGVGKNMVRSIRHWCETLGLLERVDRAGRVRPTLFGSALFGRRGWDPYLENPGTLWLLHWHLVTRRDRASAWYLAFTKWNTDLFTRDLLVDWLLRVLRDLPDARATAASLRRDIDVFLRTYAPLPRERDLPIEDTFECPLVELGLIRELDKGLYQFVRGPKDSLPDLVFLYTLLDYWKHAAIAQETISFEQLLHGPGSPGACFKLSENALAERLERLPRWTGLAFDETAGMRTVLRRAQSAARDPMMALKRFYELVHVESAP